MDKNKALVIIIGMIVFGLGVGATISSFAPDLTAQRIEACMTQPNMQYITKLGAPQCVPIERNEHD